MTRLADLTVICRSKNAGPFLLTLDAVCRDAEAYSRIRRSGVINAATIGRAYSVDPADVRIVEFPLANAFKVNLPRLVSSGDAADTDVYGAQQHVPLMDLEIP
jgi:Domain of unknown function (DUF4387)